MLSHDRLPLFLELSHKRAPATHGPGRIDSLVRDVLHDIQCFDKTTKFTKRESSDNSEVFKSLAEVLGAIHQPLHDVKDHIESVATLQRQQNPNSAMTENFDSIDNSVTLSDTQDLDLRKKTPRLSTVFQGEPVSISYEAFLKDDASLEAFLAGAGPLPGELCRDSERGSVEKPKQELKEEPV